jgi:hypothetical protein
MFAHRVGHGGHDLAKRPRAPGDALLAQAVERLPLGQVGGQAGHRVGQRRSRHAGDCVATISFPGGRQLEFPGWRGMLAVFAAAVASDN